MEVAQVSCPGSFKALTTQKEVRKTVPLGKQGNIEESPDTERRPGGKMQILKVARSTTRHRKIKRRQRKRINAWREMYHRIRGRQ